MPFRVADSSASLLEALDLVESGLEDAHRFLAVLDLRLLVLAGDDYAAGVMGRVEGSGFLTELSRSPFRSIDGPHGAGIGSRLNQRSVGRASSRGGGGAEQSPLRTTSRLRSCRSRCS